MTAQELAATKPDTRTFGLLAWASEAQVTLLAQAQEIESLRKERDDSYVQALQFSAENEALKADAERYKWLTVNADEMKGAS